MHLPSVPRASDGRASLESRRRHWGQTNCLRGSIRHLFDALISFACLAIGQVHDPPTPTRPMPPAPRTTVVDHAPSAESQSCLYPIPCGEHLRMGERKCFFVRDFITKNAHLFKLQRNELFNTTALIYFKFQQIQSNYFCHFSIYYKLSGGVLFQIPCSFLLTSQSTPVASPVLVDKIVLRFRSQFEFNINTQN